MILYYKLTTLLPSDLEDFDDTPETVDPPSAPKSPSPSNAPAAKE